MDVDSCHIKGGTLCKNSNSFQQLTFVTKSSILNTARDLDPPMPKPRNTYGKQSFSWVITLLMPTLVIIWMNLKVYFKEYIV